MTDFTSDELRPLGFELWHIERPGEYVRFMTHDGVVIFTHPRFFHTLGMAEDAVMRSAMISGYHVNIVPTWTWGSEPKQ